MPLTFKNNDKFDALVFHIRIPAGGTAEFPETLAPHKLAYLRENFEEVKTGSKPRKPAATEE